MRGRILRGLTRPADPTGAAADQVRDDHKPQNGGRHSALDVPDNKLLGARRRGDRVKRPRFPSRFLGSVAGGVAALGAAAQPAGDGRWSDFLRSTPATGFRIYLSAADAVIISRGPRGGWRAGADRGPSFCQRGEDFRLPSAAARARNRKIRFWAEKIESRCNRGRPSVHDRMGALAGIGWQTRTSERQVPPGRKNQAQGRPHNSPAASQAEQSNR